MKIIHLCWRTPPRSHTAHGGGEFRYWQNLASLYELGHEVHLVLCNPVTDYGPDPGALQMAESVETINTSRRRVPRWRSWASLFSERNLVDAVFTAVPEVREGVAELAARLKPDLIWAETLFSLQSAPKHVPTVYSQHDLFHSIFRKQIILKNDRLRLVDKRRINQLKRLEFALIKSAMHTVSVSEAERDLVGRNDAGPASFIPIVGPTIPHSDLQVSSPPRVFLFGKCNTAMRVARRKMRLDLWSILEKMNLEVEWSQAGGLGMTTPDTKKWLEDNFTVHGYVEDLSTVFRPGDASLMPYPDHTGFRTKFPLAAAYGLVNIGYRITFNTTPGFEHGVNCLMADSDEELTDIIREYSEDIGLREKLARGARTLYESKYSFESQLPVYQGVIEQALSSPIGAGHNR